MHNNRDLVEKDLAELESITLNILNGEIDILVGARRLATFAHYGSGELKRLLYGFLGIDSQIDHLPIEPEERKHWSPAALVEKDLDIQSYRDCFKDSIPKNCRALASAWLA